MPDAMWLRETVRRCEECDATTAHSRRRVSLPLLFVVALVAGAGWVLVGGGVLGVRSWIVPGRDRCLHVECERCRAYERLRRRRKRPTLDGTTEINIV